MQYHPEWHHIMWNHGMWARDEKENIYKCKMGMHGDIIYEKIQKENIPIGAYCHLFAKSPSEKIPVDVGKKK